MTRYSHSVLGLIKAFEQDEEKEKKKEEEEEEKKNKKEKEEVEVEKVEKKVLQLPTPKNHWKSLENQRRFLEEIALKIGFPPSQKDGFYSLSRKQFHELGGGSLLALYNDSVYSLLNAVFPETEWLPWRFSNLPRKAIQDSKMLRTVVAYVEKTLTIKRPEEWYRLL